VTSARLKRSIEILSESPYPLVIFPEGDIYHHSDRISPFRDGAAAIALSASKRADRKIVVIPCALKCFYVSDPTASLEQILLRLESSLHWRPRPDMSLEERVYRIAKGLLTLKELEYLGEPQRALSLNVSEIWQAPSDAAGNKARAARRRHFDPGTRQGSPTGHHRTH